MAISGGGLTANVIITSDLDTGKMSGNWTANIASGNAPQGVGGYTQAFTFSGTASGTWSGSVVGSYEQGVINGNASGVVPSTLTQDVTAKPVVYVGSIPTMSGVNAMFGTSVNLQNVKFYGPSVTSSPQTWTGSMSGSYDLAYGIQGANIKCVNNANTATFSVNSQNASTWSGNITSGSAQGPIGSYPGGVNFSGTAAGTKSSGTFSGTASGTSTPK